MKTHRLLIFCFLFLALSALAERQAFAQSRKLIVSNLKGSGYLGCGCAFQTLAEAKKPGSTKIVFWSENRNDATFNLNGKDTAFKLVKEGKRPQNQKIGSRFSDVYAADGVTVKIDFVTTHICARGDVDCEATSYNATITATKGRLKTILKTRGACGC